MNGKKWKLIGNSADIYKKLPKDKQMFILGFMQGVLSSQSEKTRKNTLRDVEQSGKAFGQLSFNDLEM